MADDIIPPPDIPQVPIEHVRTLIDYCVAYARWLTDDLATEPLHDRVPPSDALAVLSGYKFMALMLSESYDLVPPPESA